jgi:hypothetical protein
VNPGKVVLFRRSNRRCAELLHPIHDRVDSRLLRLHGGVPPGVRLIQDLVAFVEVIDALVNARKFVGKYLRSKNAVLPNAPYKGAIMPAF